MDPVCCLAGICCPPGSPEQLEVLEKMLTEYFKGDATKAKTVAEKVQHDLVQFSHKLLKACEDCEAEEAAT